MASYVEIARTLPWFYPVCLFLLGACVGSFLNVCIYRIPKGESVVSPGSHCACGKPIAWRDNIPILSWLLLRGRARCCGRQFSFRYCFVELLTGSLFVTCWLLFPLSGKALAGCVLAAIVICATFTDIDGMVIPDAFTIGGGMVGVLLSFLLPSMHGHFGDIFVVESLRSGVDGILGLMVGSGLVLWIALVAEAILKKEAMGFGDVKYLGALGAFVGWKGAVFAMFGGAVLGCVWFAFAVIWQKAFGRAIAIGPKVETAEGQPAEIGLGVHVSFGPMLGIAALIYYLALHSGFDRYVAIFQSQM
ncbi:MAG TPA: prepilin peptidase [Candidatus Didemnitutus sp.]|jgi:leader peptidase (prepilin peptidase)/N-methyltransferase